jgi:hypothetical protein
LDKTLILSDAPAPYNLTPRGRVRTHGPERGGSPGVGSIRLGIPVAPTGPDYGQMEENTMLKLLRNLAILRYVVRRFGRRG